MNNNFKRMLFSSLVVSLFVISNIIGLKYTNFMGLTLSVNFLFLPFVYLGILLIDNMFGRKEAGSLVLITAFIQLVFSLGYILVVKLGNQSLIPDMANEVNALFQVNIWQLLTGVVAFIVSEYILIYIYEYLKVVGYHLMGVVLSFILSLFIYGLITISISTYSLGINLTVNMLMCHGIMSILMTIIVTVIFYLLKDRDYFYQKSNVFINDSGIEVSKSKRLIDKPIEEVISNTNNNYKKSSKGRKSVKNSHKNNSKVKNSHK